MKNKIQWIFWSGMVCLLILLYLISSTDLVLSERVERVYNLSVIMDESSEANYARMKLGMEEAVAGANADVTFLTLQHTGDSSEQEKLIRDEWDNGADAVILIPTDPQRLQEWLKIQPHYKPVISIGAAMEAAPVKQVMLPGQEEALQSLKREVERAAADDRVYLLQRQEKQEAGRRLTEQLTETLGLNEEQLILYQEGELEPQWAGLGDETAVLIATDAGSMEDAMTAQQAAGSRHRLYGFGMTDAVIAGLQQEKIAGLVVSNQYQIGYQAVVSAVAAAKNEEQKESTVGNEIWISPQDLYEQETETIIFPLN